MEGYTQSGLTFGQSDQCGCSRQQMGRRQRLPLPHALGCLMAPFWRMRTGATATTCPPAQLVALSSCLQESYGSTCAILYPQASLLVLARCRQRQGCCSPFPNAGRSWQRWRSFAPSCHLVCCPARCPLALFPRPSWAAGPSVSLSACQYVCWERSVWFLQIWDIAAALSPAPPPNSADVPSLKQLRFVLPGGGKSVGLST